jgi:hypothetical protein
LQPTLLDRGDRLTTRSREIFNYPERRHRT